MKYFSKRTVLALVLLFSCGAALFAMRPRGEVGCTGTYYGLFTEVELPCAFIDEDDAYVEGHTIACNFALFNNCNYDTCCR